MGISSKEVILAALRLEKTTRVPVTLLSGGAWTLNRRGLSLEQALRAGPEQLAEIMAETNELIHSDIIWPGSGYHNLAIRALGGNIKFRKKGTPDVLEPLIKDAKEIDQFDFEDIKKDEDIHVLTESARLLSKKIGDTTLVGASQWGPFTLAGLVYGVEGLMRNVYRDKGLVREVMDFAAELCYQYLAAYIDAGVGIVSVADPTSSGDMISREQFKEFSLPYLQKMVKKVKEKSKDIAVCIHICGNITNRLDLIPETGTSMVSLDYKVDLHKANEILGGRIAFSGNLNPVAVMQATTPEQVKAAAHEAIEKAGAENHYILMPGCDIPPTVPIENIKAMVEVAHSYQF